MNPYRALCGKDVVAALKRHGFEVIRTRAAISFCVIPMGVPR
jgi:predicted RNA binding protein YcfA (HicA-like mRNA interferase family)